jgi:hypothetical protein
MRDHMADERDIFDVMTEEEIAKLKNTHDCPFCGFGFCGYPTGWAWMLHIREHLIKAGRMH